MRIGFDVSHIQKTRAGIGQHAYQLLKALITADDTNEYILHGWSFGIDKQAIANVAQGRTKLSVRRIPGAVKQFYWNKLRLPNIESLLGEIDVFHSSDPFLPPTLGRRICTVHDLAYRKFPEWLERKVIRDDRFVRRSVDLADAVIVPSQQTKLDLIEIMDVDRNKIHIVNVPPNSIFSSAKAESDLKVKEKFSLAKPYILFVGTVEPRKNIPSIVKAFETVPDRVDLVIVGKKGWHTEESLRSIESSSAKARIHYLEYVTDEELASLYRRALCFVYPSFYEGYGFPLLEAMASGIPIITSNNSSMREIADGVALLVSPSSVEDIAEAMNMLVSDEVRRVEMRQRGMHIVEQYTAERAAKSVLNIYNSLAS